MKLFNPNIDRKLVLRVFFYIFGLFILALGITLNTKAGLGVSAIISVPYSVSTIFDLNFGDMTFVMYAILVAAQFIIKGKDRQMIDLLQLILSIVFTRFINVFNVVIPPAPDNFLIRLSVLWIAIIVTGIGAAMSVNARLVPNPGDGIVSAIADRIGKDMGFVKNCVDLVCILTTISIGLFFQHEMVGVGLGTVLSVIFVGRSIWLYNKLFSQKVATWSGLSVKSQAGNEIPLKTEPVES